MSYITIPSKKTVIHELSNVFERKENNKVKNRNITNHNKLATKILTTGDFLPLGIFITKLFVFSFKLRRNT